MLPPGRLTVPRGLGKWSSTHSQSFSSLVLMIKRMSEIDFLLQYSALGEHPKLTVEAMGKSTVLSVSIHLTDTI